MIFRKRCMRSTSHEYHFISTVYCRTGRHRLPAAEKHSYTSSTLYIGKSQTEELLNFLAGHKDELTKAAGERSRMLTRDYDLSVRSRRDEFVAYQMLINDAQSVWHKAKKEK